MHDANIERVEAGKDAVAVQQADKKWYAAVALNVLAGLLDAGAFAFAAQSIINSLGGVSVILYALIIPCWNRRELEHLKATKFAAFYGCFVIVRILCSRLLLLVTPTTSNPNLFLLGVVLHLSCIRLSARPCAFCPGITNLPHTLPVN